MLIIGNGKTITRDANLPFIEDGAVAIEGTRIKEIGATKDMKEKYKEAEYIDARGGVIMPAFINTHEQRVQTRELIFSSLILEFKLMN